jgi:hypothetical protein
MPIHRRQLTGETFQDICVVELIIASSHRSLEERFIFHSVTMDSYHSLTLNSFHVPNPGVADVVISQFSLSISHPFVQLARRQDMAQFVMLKILDCLSLTVQFMDRFHLGVMMFLSQVALEVSVIMTRTIVHSPAMEFSVIFGLLALMILVS